MTAVLLVDDDRALRKLLRAYLQEEAISVLEAASGEEALASIERAPPDLVLLDVRLPGMDGFEVLRRLEARGAGLPVILLTSLEDELDQLVAYRLGAVDFLTKPVSPKLLAAKVKAFARHVSARDAGARRTSCGALTIDHDAFRASVGGLDVPLTRLEFGLLAALAEHPGWVYSRDHLLVTVWGIDGSRVETRIVDQHVANLRRKLSDAGAGGVVETVRGVGYRLVGQRDPAS